MLVNNLCCDPICLSKIFSTNKDGLYRKNYSDKAKPLSIVLPYVQDGLLKDSTYKLESVQSVDYLDVTRYELLYHIINSYEGSYLPKRAIVDYDVKTNKPWLVDWREVTWEGNYSKVERTKIDENKNVKIIEEFPEVYPQPKQADSYIVSLDILTEVKQYKVVFKNPVSHQK